MIFDATSFLKEIQRRFQIYELHILSKVQELNPNFIEGVNKRVGDKQLTKEETDEIVKEIIEAKDFVSFTTDWEIIKELFIIDEQLLSKYKIE